MLRSPAVAGQFYPGNEVSLVKTLNNLIPDINPEEKKEAFAVISPHAGYIYSGGVAARAYRQIFNQEIDIVAVISPSHREFFTQVSIYDGFGYATPLGIVPVHRELAKQLAATNPQIILSDKGHRLEEHALEVQIPLLQKVLGSFELLPIGT